MQIYRILLFVVCLFIQSCATPTLSSIHKDNNIKLDENSGYMLLGIDTFYSLESIKIDGPKDFVVGPKDLSEGSHFFIVALPAGHYNLTEIKINDWEGYKLTNNVWGFDVKAGQISYVGHLRLWRIELANDGFNTELENRSSLALVFLEQHFSNLLNARKLVYTGPGNDKFFSYVNKLEGIK